jgi:uncharacterized protein (DUF433 family)
MNPRITADPNICGGEPCIAGTRIPVHVILSHMSAGDDIETILKEFPRIEREDIRACLEYATFLCTEKALE